MIDLDKNNLSIKNTISTQSFKSFTKYAFTQFDQELIQSSTTQSFVNDLNININNKNLKSNNHQSANTVSVINLLNSTDDLDVKINISCLAKGVQVSVFF